MKKLFTILLLAVVFAFINTGCSDDCDGTDPKVQLINNGTGKADVQIKTSGGNTENINNIQPGASSENRSFSQGSIEFTITIQGVQDPIVYSLEIFTCNEYKVTVNEDNTVTSAGDQLNKNVL